MSACLALAAGALTSSSLETFVDSMTLTSSFNPIKEAYWTGYPHHRRTPFAVSPDGKTAYLAYLDSSGTGVHVQGVNPSTFAAVGDAVTVSAGLEAGGLVAHNDGFALLTNEVISGQNDGKATPVLYRYTDGAKTFKTLLGGSGIDASDDLASPDINGDLVFSETAGYYAAYIVVTSTSGSASGHFGDAIRYITTDGTLKTITGASSSWGCSHNTGIAFEEADAPPFASLCAEDQGAIWLNTKTQGMSNDGVKVSNEHVINGASNEPMGGMSGSYSVLARFQNANSYIFSWVSRGAIDLTENTWMGSGYTTAKNRTNNRNIAVALFSDKNTLVGKQATSVVGAEDGDSQVNWLTSGSNDCSNAHVATFDKSNALVTWEEISNPICDFDAMGCRGTFAGTKFQLVTSSGTKSGTAITSEKVYVAGDMVTMSDGRICWPYVSMTWSLEGPTTGTAGKKMSFACMTNGSGGGSSAETPAAKTSAAAAASSSVQAVEESSVAETTPVPSDAPRPSLVTLSDASDVLATPTTEPTTTPGGSDDDDDCDEEPTGTPIDTPIGTPVGTPVRTRGGRHRTRRIRPTGVSDADAKSCSGHTVTETVYVTATPNAAGWPWN